MSDNQEAKKVSENSGIQPAVSPDHQPNIENKSNQQDNEGLPMSVVCFKLMSAGWD